MKYFIRGKKAVTLTQNDFIAKGGEGQIYGKGDTIFKIYTDPSKMIPEAKIMELQKLNLPNILKPEDIVLDQSNAPVGFTMKWAKETLPLCKLFTNDFRTRCGVTDDSTQELTENIKESIYYIHRGKCLMVDGNEFNYLVDKNDLVTPWFIDTDSWQTPGFPATAIMPSIRDWHCSIFSELSDWFSFAIIACQLFVGIHPFKGSHPDFKKNDLEKRMKANVSIFNPQVRIPPAARDFGKIPSHYLAWFIDLFEKGKRTLPPALPGQVIVIPVQRKAVQHSGRFEIESIRKFAYDILWHRFHAGMRVAATAGHIFIDSRTYPVPASANVIFTEKKLIPVFARMENRCLKLETANALPLSFPELQTDEIMVIGNTLYARHLGDLTEISVDDSGKKPIAGIRNVWNIMPYSAQVFEGMIYQNVLGKAWLAIPLPGKQGSSSCIMKAVPELDDYRIIDAKHDDGVCILMGHKQNSYDRIILRFDRHYGDYDCRIAKDADLHSVNFVTLEKGIAVSIYEDTVEIFSKQPHKADSKKITGPDIDETMHLCKEGNSVMFFKADTLYSLRMSGGA
ncbi:MAG: hypothetical protein AB7S75_14525 [Desulfococcaceae bacterium]